MVRTMKLKLLFSSLCAALVVGFPTAVQAQRLVPGQKGLEVSASVPIVKENRSLSKIILGWLCRFLTISNGVNIRSCRLVMNSKP